MAITERNRRAHILLVPLSAIGHFQPILHILYHLVDERYNDVVVTVMGNKQRVADVAKLQKRGDFAGLDLRLEEVFGEIPSFPDPCFPQRANAISEAMERDFEPIKRRLIRDRHAFEAPTSIIGDMLFDWLAVSTLHPLATLSPRTGHSVASPSLNPRRLLFSRLPVLPSSRVFVEPHKSDGIRSEPEGMPHYQ